MLFRTGLPINYLKKVGFVNSEIESVERTKIEQKVTYLLQKMINYVDVDQAADKLGKKFIYDSMPPVLSKMEAKFTSKYDGDYMKDGKVLNRFVYLILFISVVTINDDHVTISFLF